jgi:shikimate kinase
MFETTRRHIYLAGFMGTGKSTIGREVARRLGWGHVDLDEYITSKCHRSIADIFESEGEHSFRIIEARALRLAVISPHSVISLGGGTPIRRDNARIIKSTGRCWLLKAELAVIWERVRHAESRRPLLAGILRGKEAERPTLQDFEAVVSPLLERRMMAYSQVADSVIDTSAGSVDHLAGTIVDEYNAIVNRGAVE